MSSHDVGNTLISLQFEVEKSILVRKLLRPHHLFSGLERIYLI